MNKVLTIMFSIIFTILFSSFFIVYEGHKGIVLRFDKILRNVNDRAIIYEPGIHIKLPFFEVAKIIDSRIQTTSDRFDKLVTKEKKKLIIDSYIKWKVNDFSRYYLVTGGDSFQAETLLKQKFSDILHSEIRKMSVNEIIINSKNHLTNTIQNLLNTGNVTSNHIHQNNIFLNFSKDYNNQFINVNSIKELGIDIIDVRILKISLPVDVSSFIYNKMKMERESIARNQLLKGQEEAKKLQVIANCEVTKILTKAYKKASIIKSDSEAIVAKLFSDAFSTEPEFYAFLRSLQAYEKIFKNNHNLIVLDTNSSEFFKYMTLSQKK